MSSHTTFDYTPTELLAGYLQLHARMQGEDETTATEVFTFTDAADEPDVFAARRFAEGVRRNLAPCPYKGYIVVEQAVNRVILRMVPPPVHVDGPTSRNHDRPITTSFH